MTIDDKTLEKAIRPLGRTREGVRKKLLAAGAYGTPQEPNACAVAEYLRARFPDEANVEVDGASIVVNGASVGTPYGVTTFIRDFDDLDIPELIRHNDNCTGVSLQTVAGDDPHEVECYCGTIYRAFGERAEASTYLRRAKRGVFPAAT